MSSSASASSSAAAASASAAVGSASSANTGGGSHFASLPSGKRRKCGDGAPPGGGRLGDLPEALLVHVASFLVGDSIATCLLAMATGSQSAGKAILANLEPWGVLDFGDIEKVKAKKMTDRDVAELVAFFISQSKLRRLKLAGLVNITGEGLDPLRAYSSLEQIDLSLVKQYEKPDIDPTPALTPAYVINILDTLLRNGSSLKQIQLPKAWREGDNELVGAFLENYSQFLGNLKCQGILYNGKKWRRCKSTIRDERPNPVPLIADGSRRWIGKGIQRNACYQCNKILCAPCVEDGPSGQNWLSFCHCCEKMYCSDCEEVLYCEGGGGGQRCRVSSCSTCGVLQQCDGCLMDMNSTSFCPECSPLDYCDVCNRSFCGDIFRGDSNGVSYCDQVGCNKNMCNVCMDNNMRVEDSIQYCEVCDMVSCRDCLVSLGNGCDACRAVFGIEVGGA